MGCLLLNTAAANTKLDARSRDTRRKREINDTAFAPAITALSVRL